MIGKVYRGQMPDTATLPDVEGVLFVLVPNASAYAVGDDGSLWSCKVRGKNTGASRGWVKSNSWRRLRAGMTGSGYLGVRYSLDDGRWVSSDLHRVVLLSFRGEPPTDSHEAAHEDGNRLNCRLANLGWKTKAQNTADKERHGTHRRGSSAGRSKFSPDDVVEVLRLRADGWLQQAIADRFGVPNQTISQLLRGNRYKAELERARSILSEQAGGEL